MVIFNFNYHPETRKYVGKTAASINPLSPTEYLLPANAVREEPPKKVDGYEIIRDNNKWELKEIIVSEEKETIEEVTEIDEKDELIMQEARLLAEKSLISKGVLNADGTLKKL